MNYKILEAHVIFKNDKLQEVTVLWEANEDTSVRATTCNNVLSSGYMHLNSNDKISDDLLQAVARQGMYLPKEKRNIYFPNIKNWDN